MPLERLWYAAKKDGFTWDGFIGLITIPIAVLGNLWFSSDDHKARITLTALTNGLLIRQQMNELETRTAGRWSLAEKAIKTSYLVLLSAYVTKEFFMSWGENKPTKLQKQVSDAINLLALVIYPVGTYLLNQTFRMYTNYRAYPYQAEHSTAIKYLADYASRVAEPLPENVHTLLMSSAPSENFTLINDEYSFLVRLLSGQEISQQRALEIEQLVMQRTQLAVQLNQLQLQVRDYEQQISELQEIVVAAETQATIPTMTIISPPADIDVSMLTNSDSADEENMIYATESSF